MLAFCRNIALHKGMVRKIRFAPGKENHRVLILLNEEVQIWDKTTVSGSTIRNTGRKYSAV